jgi:hypothetical protein
LVSPPDQRVAEDVANAAGLLLRNTELTERLREQVQRDGLQESELTASRRRVVVARDAARQGVGRSRHPAGRRRRTAGRGRPPRPGGGYR